MAKKVALVERSCCVACGVCMGECPKNAIQIWKGCWAEVNEVLCVGCGKCEKACPAGCITRKALEVQV